MANDSHIPDFSIKSIGIVHSCFKEKFAIPRQPALAPAARGEIELLPPYDDPVAIEGLENVSHLWLSFIFHQAIPKAVGVYLEVLSGGWHRLAPNLALFLTGIDDQIFTIW